MLLQLLYYSIFLICVFFAPSHGNYCIKKQIARGIAYERMICDGSAALPDTFERGVRELQLHDFRLTILQRRVFRKLPGLLYFNATNLGVFLIAKDAFEDVKLLESVFMTGNELNGLSPDIFADSRVSSLSIENNKNLVIPSGEPFLNSQSISLLSLKSCGLSEVSSETFINLPSLTYINLAKNLLTALPDNIFLNNKVLRVVDLEKNKFTTLSPTYFESHPGISVYLKNNPWHCDCHLSPLILWAKEEHHFPSHYFTDNIRCEKPNNISFTEIENPPQC